MFQPSKAFIGKTTTNPSQRPTHDGENTRFVGELEKFQGNCYQILPGTPAAAWKTVEEGSRAPKRSQRAGHKKIKTEEVEVLSEETKNKLSQNWLLVKKLVTKLVIAHGFWNFTVLHG